MIWAAAKFTAWLMLRSLESLAVRQERACANAAVVAAFLRDHPIVSHKDVSDAYLCALALAHRARLATLDEATSAALLDTAAPGLAPTTRSRVLVEAAGNPLALLELPAAGGAAAGSDSLPGGLPLTERLERAFSSSDGCCMTSISPPTRRSGPI